MTANPQRHPKFDASLLAAVLAALLYPGAWAAETPAAPAPAGDHLVLDERCYWRHFVRFGKDRISPAMLDSEGEKVLGAPLLDRKKKEAERWMAGRKLDPAKTKWTQCVFYPSSDAEGAPPPDNWTAADFNDRDWPLLRKPLRMGMPGIPNYWGWNADSLGIQSACYRSRFEISDPAKCGALKLKLQFRGGVRVFINGTEIGRAGLPDGALSPDVQGSDYPEEAYVVREDEWPAGAKTAKQRAFCPELYGPFEKAYCQGGDANLFRNGLHGRNLVPRAAWDRIQKLRDRELGPLAVPPGLLKKGMNVLAVELRGSPLHPVVLKSGEFPWEHVYVGGLWCTGQILRLEVRAQNPLPPVNARPSGVQVWACDVHDRIHTPEFLPPGEAPGAIRIVGARNGAHAAQFAIGTSAEAAGLAVTPGDLKIESGAAVIPASACTVLYGVELPLVQFTSLGWSRHVADNDPLGSADGLGERTLLRYSPADPAFMTRAEKMAALQNIKFFDQFSPQAPKSIPAGSAMPVWLSWKTPADAAPGIYRGAVKVEATGAPATTLPVEIEISAWRIPDPRDFQTVVTVEQSPYGIAAQYKVPLWSDEHFKLMESSLKLLARVGNDRLTVPVIHNTEFGNKTDSAIKWIRKADGALAFDYTALDKYLDLAVKSLGGAPRIIDFVVMHGFLSVKDLPTMVTVQDEKSGKSETLTLAGPGANADEARKNWKAFATSLYEHMQAKKLDKSMFWGYRGDTECDPDLKTLLKEFAPGVFWASGAHASTGDLNFYKVAAIIYDSAVRADANTRGWNKPYLHLSTPRWGGAVHTLDIATPSFSYRLEAERAIVMGRMGIGRMGADYYGGVYLNPPPKTIVPGISVLATFWPAKSGVETSARYEMMLEGIQETEARIVLEQALDRKALTGDLAARARKILDDHYEATLYIQRGGSLHPTCEYACGWMDRTRALYKIAAEAAEAGALTRPDAGK